MKLPQLLIATLAVIAFSCKSPDKKLPEPVKRDTTISIVNAYSELFFDSTKLESFMVSENLDDSMAVSLRNFYNQRNFQYAWFFPQGMADYATTFLNLQNDYLHYSGDSSTYIAALQPLIDSLSDSTTFIRTPDSIKLKTELLLTEQFFRYASSAYAGRKDISTKDLGWFIPRKKIDAVEVLDSMLKHKGQNLTAYEPVNRQYNLLKEYLVKYYAIEKGDGWKPIPIPSGKKSLREGDSSETIAALRQRLFLYGDLKQTDSSNLFDTSLTAALKNYQRRFGLKDDGVAGPALLAQMNKPVSDRIRQLLINMERLRWVPAEPKEDYLLVNIPEYRLHVYENGKYAWNMNVVVGSQAHSTVIFNGDMKYVVFSPYWNVPPSIIKNEVVPGMARNKNYLANHNMEWNGGAVRQKPGIKNSLGLVKFLFPNSYNIYLHDTPSKSLFNESSRAFSHGCIRLAEPKKLAIYLLRNEPAWDSTSITKAMNAGKEKYVTLKKTLPVFICYFTAWVDRNGQLNFRDDVYGHDKEMAARLFRK
ncbi:L,D-transpeptidase family protein [Terrimonas sp. NA20]|uniref:L,D-transpeptidase family protein n=1 Tax=Terrimonas ginsenosidimutans TaxID=2908004 RepID=A0ABS9KVV7_9BACT|nr:L,D-transpeptidase family protein [Terrimonas ginsenosidimutans]MCG2616474.1 L,D-transpeptidase family protein [Terrimonas ginsenosidimutans]